MLKPVLTNPWVRALALLLALILSAFLLYLLTPVLVPLFFAFLVAYMLDPVVDVFEKRKIPRSVTIAGLAVLGIILLLAVPVVLVPRIIEQANGLVAAAREGFQNQEGISGWVYDTLNRLPLREFVEAVGLAPEEQEDYDPLSVIGVAIGEWIRGPAIEFLRAHAAEISEAGGQAGAGVAAFFRSIGQAIVNSITFVGNLVLFGFVAGYLLRDYDDIVKSAKTLVPQPYRETTFRLTRRIDDQLKGFLRGQMLVCLCLGLMYAIGLIISGVPFAVPIAIIAGVASFIPYIGPLVMAIPAAVFAFIQYQGIDWHMLGVVITLAVSQGLEGSVISPKIVGDQVGLGPVWVILAVVVFGNALGFLGVLLAIPIAASLKVLILEALDRYRQSTLFQEGLMSDEEDEAGGE